MTQKYKVTGMSCAACSARVERAVSSLLGVESCAVNLLTGDMTVEGEVTRDTVVDAVLSAGYGVDAVGEKAAKEVDKAARSLRTRLIASLGLVAVIMYLSMGHMIGLPDPLKNLPIVNGILQMLIAASVMIINRRFFISGVRGVIHRAPNMDTLVSLGSLASFGYSVFVLFAMGAELSRGGSAAAHLHGLYFESAAMILALITLGKMLEARAKGKTTSALEGLISLKGKYATLLVDGMEKTVSVDDVKVGDIFVVRPGESIPTDGVVVLGMGAIDESMLTGESIPRDVLEGDSVFGGSINRSGFITVRATTVGEGTLLAGIIKMVEEASGSKAPIAKLADKVSAVFVPSVLLISLITLFGWLIAGAGFGFAIARAISVLVISCPCALGLATPVAIMVGSGVGARHGVLFKTATAIEEMGRVDTVVLDKTGTLTVGKPTVTDVIPSGGVSEGELLSLAYSVERMSEHPIARAIVGYAEANGIASHELTDFESRAGRGVSGKVDGKEILAISFSEAKTILSDGLPKETAQRLAGEGKTPIAFIYGGKYIGAVAVSDSIKPDAAESIKMLKDMHLRVVMLSGDNELTARAVAGKIGIDEVVAGVLPDGKEAVIRSLMEDGKVCMVGDGINDSPALTRADVGVAIGHGTDIAIDSADVVVMGRGTLEIAYAIDIGRRTLRNVKENLFWAFLYNVIGIPLAAGLFGLSLSPMIGAGMMSLSSFCVVANALRLNLWRPKQCADISQDCKDNAANVTDINEIQEKVEDMTVTIKVEGMMCPHCEARVKKACESVEGVSLATPSHTEGTVVVVMTDDVSDKCRKAIADAGYDVVD